MVKIAQPKASFVDGGSPSLVFSEIGTNKATHVDQRDRRATRVWGDGSVVDR